MHSYHHTFPIPWILPKFPPRPGVALRRKRANLPPACRLIHNPPMSHLVARILLSIFVIPLAAIVYGVSIIASFEILDLRSGAKVFLTAGMATWVFVAGYWFLLWRSTVRWTSARVSASAIAVFVSFVGGSLVGLARNPRRARRSPDADVRRLSHLRLQPHRPERNALPRMRYTLHHRPTAGRPAPAHRLGTAVLERSPRRRRSQRVPWPARTNRFHPVLGDNPNSDSNESRPLLRLIQ
jgi:hypothetical protein